MNRLNVFNRIRTHRHIRTMRSLAIQVGAHQGRWWPAMREGEVIAAQDQALTDRRQAEQGK